MPQTAVESYRYEELAEELHRAIEAGTFGPGDRVPSVRSMAERMKASVGTVLQAYAILENRGVIESRPQSGHFVCIRPRAIPEKKEFAKHIGKEEFGQMATRIFLDIKDHSLVQLGHAVPDPEMIPTAKLTRSMGTMGRRYPHLVNSYDVAPGCEFLRIQVARRIHAAGYNLSPDELVTTNGAQEAIMLGLSACTEPGDTVLMESPTFYGHYRTIESLHRKIEQVPANDKEGIDLAALERLLATRKISAMLFVLNFANPLGSVTPPDKKRAIVELARRYDIALIEDDIYGELAFCGNHPGLAKSYDTDGRVLIASSVSKTLAPGYRVGWIAPGRYFEQVLKLKIALNIGSPMPTQLAVADFLENGSYDRHLRKTRKVYRANCREMRDAIFASFPPGTRASDPAGGFVVWVELPFDCDTTTLYDRCIAEGFTIAPGRLFAREGASHCIRLNAAAWGAAAQAAVAKLGRWVTELEASCTSGPSRSRLQRAV